MRTLENTALNPNVHSILLVGLGCEKTSPYEIRNFLEKAGKRVEMIILHEHDVKKGIQLGIEIASKLVREASREQRVPVPLSSIVLAVECGGSDFTSGLAANPVIGRVADMIVAEGGSVILSEITELIGAESLFENRVSDDAVREKLNHFIRVMLEESKKSARAHVDGVDMPNNISPGNVKGGLTTIEEKALGAAVKGGTSEVVDVVDYAELLKKRGLTIMNSPGYDIESVTGMVASGANIVLFSSGAGTPSGNPIVPVIKVTGNELTESRLPDMIDFSAAPVLEGYETIQGSAEKLLDLVVRVANGLEAKAEALGQDDFSIWNIGIKM
jgi:altronate dehydratase large subunit